MCAPAGLEGAFARLAVNLRFEILARRAVENLDLPRPGPLDEGSIAWRRSRGCSRPGGGGRAPFKALVDG